MTVEAISVSTTDVGRCPIRSLAASHYHRYPDGSVDCACVLPQVDGCSFTASPESDEPCACAPTKSRTLGGLALPACTGHERAGGTLYVEAQRAYRRAVVARQNRDVAESANRLGIVATEVAATRHLHCRKCFTPLFPGNTSELCADCHEDDDR